MVLASCGASPRGAEHEAIAVDLPGDGEHAGLTTCADRVEKVIGGRRVILVAQSLGAFTAAMVCERVDVSMLLGYLPT